MKAIDEVAKLMSPVRFVNCAVVRTFAVVYNEQGVQARLYLTEDIDFATSSMAFMAQSGSMV